VIVNEANTTSEQHGMALATTTLQKYGAPVDTSMPYALTSR